MYVPEWSERNGGSISRRVYWIIKKVKALSFMLLRLIIAESKPLFWPF